MSEILQTDHFTCSYDISRKIDHGRFGHVFLCRHKENMTEYAVKFVSETKMAAICILREAAICFRLEHRNIVKIMELYKDTEKRLFQLVFEMAWEGELYDDIVNVKGRYNELEASHCLEQILQGVAYIHRNEFVHRDLTPDNILLANSGNCTVVKIADFGSAIALSNEGVFHYQEDRKNAGRFGYCLAPEMRIGEFCSHSVDLWACGAILYLMIYGEPSFSGGGDVGLLLNQMLNKGPEDGGIKGLRKDTINLISQFLNLDEENRPSAESSLTHPFILNHRGIRSRFHYYNVEAEPTSSRIDETKDYPSTSAIARLDDSSQNIVNGKNESPALLEEKTSSFVAKKGHVGEKKESSSVESSTASQVKKRRLKAPKSEALSISSSCVPKRPRGAASSTSNKKEHTFLKPTRRSARKAVTSRVWKHKRQRSQNSVE